MGTHDCPFQDIDTVLNRFGKTLQESRERYHRFLEEGVKKPETAFVLKVRKCADGGRRSENPGLWVIGDHDFVKNAFEADHERRLRISRYAAQGLDPDQLSARTAKSFGVEPDSLKHRGRGNAVSHARKVFAYAASRQYEMQY